MIVLKTNVGVIKIELDYENTPETAKNFEKYVKGGFYEGVIFHRVIPNFMIQGGGFDEHMDKKDSRFPIKNEADKGGKNDRGTVAMARTNDPDSAAAQFFINVKDNHFLNHQNKTVSGWGYCVFGKVIEGMDVVDAIQVVKTSTQNGHQDVPVEPIIIESATIED